MKMLQFLRSFSIVDDKNLSQLPVSIFTTVKLPFHSCIHYTNIDPNILGIRTSDPLLQNYGAEIRVHHVEELEVAKGNPRALSVRYDKFIRQYHREQTRLVRSRNLEKSLMKRKMLLVMNYSLLTKSTAYTGPLADYYEFYNLRNTLVKNINKIGEVKEHFIYVNLPRNLPTKAHLNNLSDKEMTSTTLGYYPTFEDLDVRELFLLMRGLGVYAGIEKELYRKVFFIIKDELRTVIIKASRLIQSEDMEVGDIDTANFNKLYHAVEQLIDLRVETDTKVVDDEDTFIVNKRPSIKESKGLTPKMESTIEQYTSAGLISAKEKERYVNLAAAQLDLKVEGLDVDIPIIDYIEVPEKDLVVEKKVPNAIKLTIDETLKESTMANFNKNYVEKVMDKHTLSMIMKAADAGCIVSDVSVSKSRDIQDELKTIKFTLNPVPGVPSNITMHMPDIKPDGTYVSGGTTYTIENQRIDKPIRKTKPNEVALTSYYGKLFISTSPKTVNDYGKWLTDAIRRIGLDSSNSSITKLKFGNNPVREEKLPTAYGAIMRRIVGFKNGLNEFHFNYRDRADKFGKRLDLEKNGHIVIGTREDNTWLMDMDNYVSLVDSKGTVLESSKLEKVLHIPGKVPRDFSIITILGKKIPLGVVISYLIGLEKALKILKVKYRIEPTNTRFDVKDTDVVIKMKDYSIIVDATTTRVQLLYAGFKEIDSGIDSYRLDQLNRSDGWVSLFAPLKLSNYHLNEMGSLRDMFIDPITKELLIKMKEPYEFVPLLLRANELLLTSDTTDESSLEYQRIRGVERIVGMQYRVMVDAIRKHRNTNNPRRSKIDINPMALQMKILNDTATQLSNELNPFEMLKQQQSVSLAGEGGRSSNTLVKRSRAFDKTDTGVISEATPDSQKVGIRTYTSPNPNIVDVYGNTKRYEKGKDPINAVMSNVAQVLPFTNHDDGKRVLTAGIIASAIDATNNYTSVPIRTGEEAAVGYKVQDQYASKATGSGVVTDVTDELIIIAYKDGDVKGYPIGSNHLISSKYSYPRDKVTDLKVGDKVNEGDIITWVDTFFERDEFNPRNVTMKIGTVMNVALVTSDMVYEDSSELSKEASALLGAPATTRRIITADFDTEILNLVKVGDKVEADSPLCIFQNSSDVNDRIDAKQVEVLMRLATNTSKVKAKTSGTVSMIEVVYLGDKVDMSDSIRKIVDKDDSRRKKLAEYTGQVASGKLSKPGSMFKEEIDYNQVMIVVYIDYISEFNAGSKLNLGSQLKTVTGRITESNMRTEDGQPVHIKFWRKSVANRIVESFELFGLGYLALEAINKQAVLQHED